MREDLRDRLVCIVLAGSRLYGTDSDSSDYDYRGVYFEKPEELLGLQRAVTSKDKEERDTTYYPLRKFFELCLKGNPNIMDILFSTAIIQSSSEWERIINAKELFLSKMVLHSLYGCMHEHEKGLQKEFNYKKASEVVRLLFTIKKLGETGQLHTTLPQKDLIKSIKYGDPAREFVNVYPALKMYVRDNFDCFLSMLPDEPDYEKAEQLLVELEMKQLKKLRL